MNKKWIWISAVLSAMLLLAACGNDETKPPADNPPVVQDNEETGSAPTQQEKEPVAPGEMKPIDVPAAVGDTIDYHGAVVTLNSVRDSDGDDYLKPQDGHTFKVVDVTVKNNGDEPLVVSSALSFSLTDATDLNYTVAITDDVSMLDGTIAPGEELTGEIPYQVLKDAEDLQLSYGDPMKEGRAIWSLD
ncbi:hypothetical protein JCM10914A_16190 [Paenibacillus sp. JCM 10914]|uniref:DUF4352 domain-containing protein n=1 Tax=Paenibacillus sp. JCM 10914 TaxID=1236974 RepID=UPI0003CC8A24|nr:DUF4352 domain-containing protein [Paenibacillus sp. JCM 10914]GAE06729.1 hypothetical protein JCM10914_2902 [Paenibacillus sp. JCM 10914]